MSAQTLAAVHDAIAAHAADVDGGAGVITDWFVGYTRMSHDGEQARWTSTYLASESSAAAVIGTAELALQELRDDAMARDEDE